MQNSCTFSSIVDNVGRPVWIVKWKPFFLFFFSFSFFLFWLAQQNCEWEMCHGSPYLCSIDEVLNIFEIETRSNPLSPVEWSLQEGLPGSAPRGGVDGVTSLAWHAVFMQHGKHYVHMIVLRWTRFEWSAIRDDVILPLTPNHLGQNKLNYLPNLKAKTEVFPGEASSVLPNKKFLENSLVPQSGYRTLSGKFSEADSTPISFTRYRSESCDSTDIAGNPAHWFCLGLHLQRDPNYASCYKNPATIIPTWIKTRSCLLFRTSHDQDFCFTSLSIAHLSREQFLTESV